MNLNIKPSNLLSGGLNEICEAKPTPTPLICENLMMFPYIIKMKIFPI